jgi:hypothetical protein
MYRSCPTSSSAADRRSELRLVKIDLLFSNASRKTHKPFLHELSDVARSLCLGKA